MATGHLSGNRLDYRHGQSKLVIAIHQRIAALDP
jgi:hypothetical protein